MTAWPDQFDVSVIYVDPSMGADTKKGDYSAIVFVGRHKEMLWVDADISRRPPNVIATDTVRMWKRYKPDITACESNGFQNMMAGKIVEELENQSLGYPPVLSVTNSINKVLRITDGLDPYLAAGKIKIKDNQGGRLLLQQLQDFPLADHDDGPDALDGAIRQLTRLISGGYQG